MAAQLTPEQFQRVSALFGEAMELEGDASARADFVRARAGDDPAVEAQLLAMLAFHDAEDPDTVEGFDKRAAAAVRHETTRMGDTVFEGTPERIGPYQVVRHVATGGMGTVYEALQRNPLRRVALKVIRTALRTPRALKRFETEGELLAGMHHPGIARVYALGHADTPHGDMPYIAMEFIDGPSITEHARRKELDVVARVRLVVQVCDALAHAHEHGIIHRDIKPSNILVDGDGLARIVDFGIARTYGGKGGGQSSISLAGQLLGTLSYMSPEQTRGGRHPLDARADVYSIGAVGFELLAGRPPYDLRGATVPEAYARMTARSAPRLDEAVPGIDAGLGRIVSGALEPDRERRIASAAELARALRAWLGAAADPDEEGGR